MAKVPDKLREFIFGEYEWAYEKVDAPWEEVGKRKIRANYFEWPPTFAEKKRNYLLKGDASLHINGKYEEDLTAILTRLGDHWELANDLHVSFVSFRYQKGDDKQTRFSYYYINPKFEPHIDDLNEIFQEWCKSRNI